MWLGEWILCRKYMYSKASSWSRPFKEKRAQKNIKTVLEEKQLFLNGVSESSSCAHVHLKAFDTSARHSSSINMQIKALKSQIICSQNFSRVNAQPLFCRFLSSIYLQNRLDNSAQEIRKIAIRLSNCSSENSLILSHIQFSLWYKSYSAKLARSEDKCSVCRRLE